MKDATSDSPAVEERAQASGMVRFQQGKPIVLKLKKGKNRKYRYSRGLGDIQKAEGQLTRVTKKAAQSVSKGVSEYDRQRRKSAGKKRDGAVRDFIPNAGIAMSEALGEAADIPTDISKMLNTKSSRRMLRRRLRMASDAVRLFPF